ncbi:hypothetical protein IQ229_04150, partial [Nostoc cf. edaphicum LEGE 07299]
VLQCILDRKIAESSQKLSAIHLFFKESFFMERLRISDLSFCEDEVSDLSQVQGGVAYGYALSVSTAKKGSYKVGKGTLEGTVEGGIAGAIAGAITDGNNVIVSANTSAGVS